MLFDLGKINDETEKRMDLFSAIEEDFLYKAPLTATVFKDFSSCYQHFTGRSSSNPNSQTPFVYVDSDGVKLVTDLVDEKNKMSDGIFALSVAGDGLVEMLALGEAS